MWKNARIFCAVLASILSSVGVTNSHRIMETDCLCGTKNHDSTVVDSRGTFSENHAWPWMVSIVNVTITEEPVAYCGATLINDRYLLTAAHCIPDMMDTGIENFKLYLGTNYIANGSEFISLNINKIISHPKFDFETADNDVGQPFVGFSSYMTGWGSFNLSEPTEDSLKEAEAVVVSNEICAKNYSTVDIPVSENMICAHLQYPEDDPCKGDSGGPLLIKEMEHEREIYSQIGIVSHGQGCTVLEYPAIYSRVSAFIDWIKENTKDAVYCAGTFSS